MYLLHQTSLSLAEGDLASALIINEFYLNLASPRLFLVVRTRRGVNRRGIRAVVGHAGSFCAIRKKCFLTKKVRTCAQPNGDVK